MADIRQTDTAAQTGMGIPDEARGPGEDASLELELESAERRLRADRENNPFGEHPNGVGATLGQDFAAADPAAPRPGANADQEDEAYDPPT
jgi:hypothetical protein